MLCSMPSSCGSQWKDHLGFSHELPSGIDAHESYEIIKGLIAEALRSGVASSKASD
jgi:hypothetical protein